MITIKHRFSGATLCEFDVATVRECAEKGKANLDGADLRGANLYGADLSVANLSGADLRGANLDGADLSVANLHVANLDGANLYEANLSVADLSVANLSGANLSGANLHGANLSVADLSVANLDGADLHGANLYGANLDGANLGEKFGKLKANGFFSVCSLGSRNDTMIAFYTDKGIFVRTGRFFDSLELFREAVIKTHGEEPKHGKLYLGMANVIEYKFSE